MTTHTSPIISSLLDVKKAQGPEKKKEKTSNPKMVMALVFLELLKTAMTETDSAISKSKQMDALSDKELAANRSAEALKFENVEPHVKFDHHKRVTYSQSFAGGTVHKHVHRWTTKKITNKGAVAAAQVHNQEISAERSEIEEKLGVYQQESQGAASAVSVIVQQSSTTMEESSGILTMIRSLTFKALLTRDIQG